MGMKFQLLIKSKMVLMLKHEDYLAPVAASKPMRCIITGKNQIESEPNKISSWATEGPAKGKHQTPTNE